MRNSNHYSNIKFIKANFYLFVVVTAVMLSKPLVGADTLRVAVYDNEPKIFIDNQGDPSGIYVTLLNKIAKKENWHLKYVYCNWDECYAALNSGKVDLLPDMAHTKHRDSVFDFSQESVLDSWSRVYSRKDLEIFSMSDLDNKRIATLEESVHSKELEIIMNGFGYDFDLIKVSSFDEAFSLVTVNVADVAVTNHFFGETHYQAYGLKKTPIVFNPAKLYYAVEKGQHAEILKTIDNNLIEWKSKPNSFYYKTLQKYGTLPDHDSGSHSHRHYIFIIIGLILVLGLIIYSLRRKLLRKKSDLKKSQLILQQEEYKLRQYFENAPYGIFVTDSTGQFIEVNRAAVEMSGFKKNELLQINFLDRISESYHDKAKRRFKILFNEGKTTSIYPIKVKNGDIQLWKIDGVRIDMEKIMGFAIDVTEHERKDDELLRLKNNLENEVAEKTEELNQHIEELEHFQEVTIERELRMEELRKENEELKEKLNRK